MPTKNNDFKSQGAMVLVSRAVFCAVFDYLSMYHVSILMLKCLRRRAKPGCTRRPFPNGADASKATAEDIPTDPKYAYGSFDLAMANQADVAESFRAGIRAIASRVALQVRQNGI